MAVREESEKAWLGESLLGKPKVRQGAICLGVPARQRAQPVQGSSVGSLLVCLKNCLVYSGWRRLRRVRGEGQVACM